MTGIAAEDRTAKTPGTPRRKHKRERNRRWTQIRKRLATKTTDHTHRRALPFRVFSVFRGSNSFSQGYLTSASIGANRRFLSSPVFSWRAWRFNPIWFIPAWFFDFGCSCCGGAGYGMPRILRSIRPVWEAAQLATSSGVPTATTCPPLSPPSGPRSMM